MQKRRLPSTVDHGVPSTATSRDKKTLHTTSGMKYKEIKGTTLHKTARWMEKALGIAATHPQEDDISVGTFENSNSAYIFTLKNLLEEAFIFYRKAHKDLSVTLAVSELWKERTEAIKKILKKTQQQKEKALPSKWLLIASRPI